MSLRETVESYNPAVSLDKASTPDASWYHDPRILKLENRTVFARSWQAIARLDQLRQAGQYVATEIAGEPILLVRGNDGVLRGFFNVCRHHAAAVITQPEGTAQNLRCPYHGWTYNLDGALILAPEFGGVENFARAANGLVPVPVGVWGQWVFVKISAGEPSLEDFLGKDLTECFDG